MSHPPRLSIRRGFTLIEVLLAMSLTVVVLFIVGTGINVQLRAFDRGRARVERAQLARVLLHRMSDDFRGLMPPDSPSTDDAGGNASTDSTDSSGGDAEAADELVAALGGVDMLGADALDTDLDMVLDLPVQPVPGVYGELDWLRIDVVRTSRSDGEAISSSLSSGDGSARTARGIETIVYYVVTSDQLAVRSFDSEGETPAGGLVRRELARPPAAYAAEGGGFEYKDTSATPLATEVTAVEFRYHDGIEWLEAWDSDEIGSLPRAIEVRLFLSPILSHAGGDSSGLSVDKSTEDPPIEYRLVLGVPFHETSGDASEAATEDVSSSTGASEAAGRSGEASQ